jgi:hypothetical protein
VSVVEQAIGGVLKPAEGKNPHAQALSALGASKGGKAVHRNFPLKSGPLLPRKPPNLAGANLVSSLLPVNAR